MFCFSTRCGPVAGSAPELIVRIKKDEFSLLPSLALAVEARIPKRARRRSYPRRATQTRATKRLKGACGASGVNRSSAQRHGQIRRARLCGCKTRHVAAFYLYFCSFDHRAKMRLSGAGSAAILHLASRRCFLRRGIAASRMYRAPRCEFYLARDICREILLAEFLGEDFLARRNSQCWVF